MHKLSDLKVGERGKILAIDAGTKVKRRLFELGLTGGEEVKILGISMLKKSFLIEVRGYALAVQAQSLKAVSIKKL